MRILVHTQDPHLSARLSAILTDAHFVDAPGGDAWEGPRPDLHIVDCRSHPVVGDGAAGRSGTVAAATSAPTEEPRLALIDAGAGCPPSATVALPWPEGGSALPSLVRLIVDFRERDARLARAEVYLNALADSKQNGLALTSLDGRIVFSNRGLRNLFGYTDEELRALPTVEQLVAPPRRAEIYRARVALLDDPEGTGGMVGLWLRQDGALINTEVAATRYLDHGEPAGLIVELQDVTDELEMRERLLETTSKLFRVEGLHGQLRALTRQTGTISRRLAADVVDEEVRAELRTLQRRAEELAAELQKITETHEPGSGPISASDLATMATDALEVTHNLIGHPIRTVVQFPTGFPPLALSPNDARRLLRHMLTATALPLLEVPRGEPKALTDPALTLEAAMDEHHLELVVSRNEVPWGSATALPRAISTVATQYGGEAHVLDEPARYGLRVRLPRNAVLADDASKVPARATPVAAPAVLLLLEDVHLHEFLAPLLVEAGYAVRSVTSRDAAIRLLVHERFEAALVRVGDSAEEIGAVLPALRAASPDTAYVLVGAPAPGAPPPEDTITVDDPTDTLLILDALHSALEGREDRPRPS